MSTITLSPNTKERINVMLPRRIIRSIGRLSKNRKRSQFIATAVDFYIDSMQNKKLKSLLQEGAQKRSERDQIITEEMGLIDTVYEK